MFPGLGHIYLKQYLSGTVLGSVSLVAMYYLIDKSLEIAAQVLAKLESGGLMVNAEAISELVSNGSDIQSINVATTVLAICWVVAIIDLYRIGRKMGKGLQ